MNRDQYTNAIKAASMLLDETGDEQHLAQMRRMWVAREYHYPSPIHDRQKVAEAYFKEFGPFS